MKKIHLILILTFLISNLSFSQNNIIYKKIKYFDEDYNPISKSKFERKKIDYKLLSVQGDSINHIILSLREKQGIVSKRKSLDSLLNLSLNIKIDSTKPLVIIYYPGKDACNSSGNATRETKKSWFAEMEKGINKIKNSNIVYVYKNNIGLFGKNDGFKEWIQDPRETIERLFFKRHYPCSSFVVISENGKFLSFFGEFSKKNIWKAVETVTYK